MPILRENIDSKYKWNLEKIYKNNKDFENELENISKKIENIKSYQGKILDSSDNLYNLFEEIIFKSKLKKDKLLEYNISYMIDDNLDICDSIKDICTPIYFKDGPLYDAKDDKIITVNNWADIYRFFKEKE